MIPSLMSALGQKQTFALHQLMSALPPKADIQVVQSEVRRNDLVTLARQGSRLFLRKRRIRIMVLVCNLVIVLATFAFGVILGRMWEIRKELRKNQSQPNDSGFNVPTARLTQPPLN